MTVSVTSSQTPSSRRRKLWSATSVSMSWGRTTRSENVALACKMGNSDLSRPKAHSTILRTMPPIVWHRLFHGTDNATAAQRADVTGMHLGTRGGGTGQGHG